MPKGSHHAAAKSGPHDKGKKSKKGRHARRFAPPVLRQISPAGGVPDTAARPVSPSLPAVPGYPYLLTDLKRIGIIAGIVFIILIVLSLVL
jgi:hypothetical protein